MAKVKRFFLGWLLLSVVMPLPSAAETLQQAWAAALSTDHTLKAAQRNAEANYYQLSSAKAARLPSLSINSAYSVLSDTPTTQVPFGASQAQFPLAKRESLSYQAMSTLPIYTSGKISGFIEAADSALIASKEVVAGKKLDIKLQVAESYIAVLRTAKSLQLVESQVASLSAHASDVKNMHQQGMVSRNDLLAAQVALADAQQLAIKVANLLDLSQSAYNRLLGRPLHERVNLEEMQPVVFEQDLPDLTAQAMTRRYELKVLQLQAKSLEATAGAIRAESGPQIALMGGYDYKENDYQLHEGQWLVNLGMQWKIFDAGLSSNKAKATDRQAKALKQQHANLAGALQLQVRQYWLALQETQKRIAVTQASISQAEENLKVNRDRYENGLSTNTEVLNAETLRTRSLNNHANAIYDAVLASIRLQRAVSDL